MFVISSEIKQIDVSQPSKVNEASPSSSSQIFIPATPNLDSVQKQLLGGYKVKFRKGTKQITLLRFLVAKTVFDSNGLGIESLLTINELYLNQIKKASLDRVFSDKYSLWLNTIGSFIERLNQEKSFPIRVDKKQLDVVEKLLKPFLPSERAYRGYQKDDRIVRSFSVSFRNHIVPPNKRVSARYIGVGYRDKGSRRQPELDGSPSWQEVSMSRTQLELLFESYSPTTFFVTSLTKERKLFEEF